jgi:hypothetical protein
MSVGATTTLHRLETAAQECQTAFSETCDLLQKVQKAISDLELFEQAMHDPGKVTPAIMAHLLKTYQATEARELPEKIHAAISEMINLLRGKALLMKTSLRNEELSSLRFYMERKKMNRVLLARKKCVERT